MTKRKGKETAPADVVRGDGSVVPTGGGSDPKTVRTRKDATYDVAWKASVDTEVQISQRFDNAILTLSAAFLALALSFIHQIAPHPKHKVLVFISWGCFSLSILILLATFCVGEAAQRRCRDILDELDKDDAPAEMPRNLPDLCLPWMNYGAAVLFALGILFLAVFAGLNL